jgi:Ca-activated chloride channel family protein
MSRRIPLLPLLSGSGSVLLLALAGCGGTQQAEPALPPDTAANNKALPLLAEARQDAPAARAVAPRPELMRLMAPSPLPVQPQGFYQDVEREQYAQVQDNGVLAVAQHPVSTFSIDVDTGSYANVRRFLEQGRLPPAEAVRLEEMVNYFPYAYPLPAGDSPFGVTTELAPTPWNAQSRLLRIAIKASEVQASALPPANLVFLVDVSGSMHRREGLPMVQATLKLLVEQLRAQDRVSLVTYAGSSQVVLESTSGADKAKIRAAIDGLVAGGSTAGESGIQLAYQQAQKGFVAEGINRILLATDGDFNVGVSDFDSLKKLAADKRRSGVSLTTLGFGTDNYNEQLMEQLADAGDGNYAYIDTLREARKVLVEQLSSTLATVARDVKIQLEFNPAQVSEYRLLGYENRVLEREDFSNDKVDAGEIGAGHTVTALYEIVPAGNRGWLEPLRYQAAAESPRAAGELGLLRLRWKAPGEQSSRLLELPLAAGQGALRLEQASEDLRFAAAVAAFAQQLKGGKYLGDFGYPQTLALARASRGEDAFGLRAEFVQLVELAQSLQTAPTPVEPRRAE